MEKGDMVAKRNLYQPGPLATDQRLQLHAPLTGSGHVITVWRDADGKAWVETSYKTAADDFTPWSRGERVDYFAPIDVSHLPSEGWWELCEITIVNPTPTPVFIRVSSDDRRELSFGLQPGEERKLQTVAGEGVVRAEKDWRGAAAAKLSFAQGMIVEVTPEMAAFDDAARAQGAWAAETRSLIERIPDVLGKVAPGTLAVAYACRQWDENTIVLLRKEGTSHRETILIKDAQVVFLDRNLKPAAPVKFDQVKGAVWVPDGAVVQRFFAGGDGRLQKVKR